MKKFSKIALALVLSSCLFVSACSVSQFEAVLNEIAPAVTTIIQIIALFKNQPADTSVATKIAADVASLEKIYSDYQDASAVAKPGIQGQINAGFVVLNADLNSVVAIAQVKDPNVQLKISALITLVQSAVNIAEASIPSQAATMSAKAPNLTASDLVSSYNHILVAKTGNVAVDDFTSRHKIHQHNHAVRVLTLGVAK